MAKIVRFSTALLCALACLLAGNHGVVRAHELRQNNGVSAVLHIPPEDNPEADQPTELDFFFSSIHSGFNLQTCDCVVTVTADGRLLQTAKPQPALDGATLESVATVRFPAVGSYDLVLSGRAKNGSFPAFKLDYPLRVTATAGAASPNSTQGVQVGIIGAGGLIVLAMIAITAIRRGGRYARQTETRSEKSR